jgi:hypothetical protein
MLSGVSGLGVGIQDGDVLTEAGGRPALTESDVVSMVIAARGKQAKAIGGQFWRNGEPWSLIVEQPYVRENGEPLARISQSAKDSGRRTVVAGRLHQKTERAVRQGRPTWTSTDLPFRR